MTHVFERLLLRCPYVRAREFLPQALTGTLRFLPGALEKNVVVRYERSTGPAQIDTPWRVRWSPETDGPYPGFRGQISILADESFTAAVLELSGDYSPPFELQDEPFDIAMGARIASNTARALLRRIGAGVEARYRGEEAIG